MSLFSKHPYVIAKGTHNLLCHGLPTRADFFVELVCARKNLLFKLLYVRSHLWIWRLAKLWLEVSEIVSRSTTMRVVDDFLAVAVDFC